MAEAAAAANVSSNVWVASFERVALVAKESLGEVQEKLIQTANCEAVRGGNRRRVRGTRRLTRRWNRGWLCGAFYR